jgi:hypothetical protein
MAGAADTRAGRAFVELYVKDQALSRGLQSASNRLRSFATGVGTMGNLLMGSILTSRVMGVADSFVKSGGAIAEMSARTGMAAETLSGLAYAASQTSVELEDVDTGVKRMQKNIASASRGNKEAAKSFADMGLSYKDLMGKSPDEQFAMVSRAIAKIEDPTLRAGSALTVFGRGGTKLLPMILEMDELTARAQTLGLVMGTEAAESAHKLERSISELHSIATRTGQVIMEVLGQSITDISKKFGEWAIAVKGFVSEHKEFANTLFKGAIAVLAVAAALQIGSWAGMFAAATFAKLAAVIGALSGVFKTLSLSMYALMGAATPFAVATAAVAALVVGTVALVAVWANAEVQGISWGESVLDLTHKLTGLRNAYSDLQDIQKGQKEAADIGTRLRVAAGIEPAIQTAAQKAGRPETPTDKALAEARKRVSELDNEIADMKPSDLRSSKELQKKVLETNIKMAEAAQADKQSGLGFFKTLFGDPIATGKKIGGDLWQGLQAGLKSRMAMMPALAVELAKIGAGAIEDPATREKTMARLDAEKAILEAKAKAVKLEADAAKERQKETPEGTAKAKEMQDEAWSIRQGLQDIESLRDAKMEAIDAAHAREKELADKDQINAVARAQIEAAGVTDNLDAELEKRREILELERAIALEKGIKAKQDLDLIIQEYDARVAAMEAEHALRTRQGNETLQDEAERAKIEEEFANDEMAKRKALMQLDWNKAKEEAGRKGLDVGLVDATFGARMRAMEAVTASTSVAGTFGSLAGMGMGDPNKQTADNTKKANGHLAGIAQSNIGIKSAIDALATGLQFA